MNLLQGTIFIIFLSQCNCVHREMDPIELHHIFGTRSRDKVPAYWLDKPSSHNHDNNSFIYEVVVEGKKEQFRVEQYSNLLSREYHSITRDDLSTTLTLDSPHSNCLYRGVSVKNNHTTIALTGCGIQKHGLILSESGEFFLIHPMNTKDRIDDEQHIIHKRSVDQIEEGHTCLFDSKDDPYPEDRKRIHKRSALMQHVEKLQNLASQNPGDLTIELAVFADDALWRHFQHLYHEKAEVELHKFILAAVNNIDILFTQRSIEPRIQIKVVRYEVLKAPPPSLRQNSHLSGDVDRLLDAFCEYQHSINPHNDNNRRHWDHALLFSGYDLYRDGLHTVAGYAPVKGMCSGERSCTINEGLDFGSVFVVTHEMGHSLGMYHDGDNECDLGCCIMSPSVGSGKTRWSRCSVNEMSTFVQRLGSDFRPPNCLRDASTEDESMILNNQENPGQLFTLDEQCEIFHGECWKHELKDGQVLQDVCSMVWCGNGEGIIRTAHPALEGTYCGQGKWCRSGVCVWSSSSLVPMHGGWSSWNDNVAPACGGSCADCKIQGQIRVRRSIRQCNRPSPNNGGAVCRGDDAIGLRCSAPVCSGESIVGYASRMCKKVRDDPTSPNSQLTGEGLQFEQAPCKVWCMLSHSNNIRTIANFPDGTPCGNGRYCIKGECRPLLCSGSTIAENENNCPESVRPTTRPPVVSKPTVKKPIAKPTAYKEDQKKNPPFWKEWSQWSQWSICVSYACDSRGYRVRARRCLAGECEGADRQRQPCNPQCLQRIGNDFPRPSTAQLTVTRTAPKVTVTTTTYVPPIATTPLRRQQITQPSNFEYSPWSGCSVSCGRGRKLRRRKNCINDCTEYNTCDMPSCPVGSAHSATVHTDNWLEWREWSQCSRSCDIGIQIRKRKCSGAFCKGSETQEKRCRNQACPIHQIGRWGDWSDWSDCSVTCGNGNRSRRRQCSNLQCIGDDRESVVCVRQPCATWRRPRSSQDPNVNNSFEVPTLHSSDMKLRGESIWRDEMPVKREGSS